jgi:hypothetical protein
MVHLGTRGCGYEAGSNCASYYPHFPNDTGASTYAARLQSTVTE